MNQTSGITPDQARQVLKQQALAQSTLTGYARYIDIPGVPDDGDVDDRIHTVVETPLAAHHIFLLNCLQLLVDGLLVYDPQVLDSPIDFSVLRDDEPPTGVRSDGGGGHISVYAPSPKSKISRSHTLQKPNMSQTYSHGVLREMQVMVGGVLNGRVAPHDAMSVISRHHPELVSCRRVMFMLPPGSAKSTYASVVFPTWVMGKVKAFETILTGWGDPICRRHGKRARQICASPAYNALFGSGLDPNTKAAEDWALTNSSSYKSSGINSGVAGFRTNGLIWDDLTKNRKEADSETIRNDVYNAYIDDARSRKTPSAWEVGIGCLVGDTQILMADGSEKPISEIQVGDRVVSYEGESEVTNWINHRDDQTYQITTSSGIMVRANERHPFLVERDGELEWVRLRNLKIGDQMVQESGAHTVGWLARQRVAKNPQNVGRCVPNATASGSGAPENTSAALSSSVNRTSSTVTASRQKITSVWSKIRAVTVRSAGILQRKIRRLITSTACPWITATTPQMSVGYCATSVTSESATSNTARKHSERRWSTCEILAIDPAGIENVYDIEVTPHENFVANGLGSHNTRWHEDEIMGRILPEGYNGESGFIRCRDGNVWFVVCMAAECERNPDEDPLGRERGQMLWEEWFTEEYWAEKRVNARSWGSLYQQRPAPESGIVFKREKFKWYTELPKGENYISYDPGVSDVGDETAMHVWRVDDAARVYLLKTFYEKCSMDVWIKELVNNVKIHRPLECISESGVIRRAAEPFIKRAMRTTKTFFNQVWVTRSANKQAMAAPALAMVNSGQVFLPKNSDGERFLDACLKFPASKDDHEVDSFANLCLRLEHIFESSPPPDTEEKVVVISGEIPIKSLMPPRFNKKKSRWQHKRAS